MLTADLKRTLCIVNCANRLLLPFFFVYFRDKRQQSNTSGAMAATATMGYEELMFQFDDLGDLGSSTQTGDESVSPPTDEQNCKCCVAP